MSVQQHKRAVGTFSNRQQAQEALNQLKNSNFPMDKVSILAQDADKVQGNQIGGAEVKEPGIEEVKEGAGIGAVGGTVLGGIGGLLVGLGALVIPGAGPFLAAGTLATTFAGAGIGAATGGLVGALTGLGIPEEQAQVYSQRVSKGEYLVMVDGTEEEIHRATSILGNSGIRDWAVFDMPSQSASAPASTSNTDIAPTGRTTSNNEVIEVVDRRDKVR